MRLRGFVRRRGNLGHRARGRPDRRRRHGRLGRPRARGLRRVVPGDGIGVRAAVGAFDVGVDAPRVAGFRRRAAAFADPMRSRAAGSAALRSPRPGRDESAAEGVRRPARGRARSQLADGRRDVARDVDRRRRRDSDQGIRGRSLSRLPRPRGGGCRARRRNLSSNPPSTVFASVARRSKIATERGVVKADAVVVATGAPIPDLRALRRHLHPMHSYVVVSEPLPAGVRRELGRRSAALRDHAAPPHLLRWLKDDRVLFAGGDQPPVPARAQDKTLVQRTGQLMYELSMLYPAISGARPEFAWSCAVRCHRRRPSLHRHAPQLSPAFVCAGPRPPRSGCGVAGCPGTAEALPERTRAGRRPLRIQPDPEVTSCACRRSNVAGFVRRTGITEMSMPPGSSRRPCR